MGFPLSFPLRRLQLGLRTSRLHPPRSSHFVPSRIFQSSPQHRHVSTSHVYAKLQHDICIEEVARLSQAHFLAARRHVPRARHQDDRFRARHLCPVQQRLRVRGGERTRAQDKFGDPDPEVAVEPESQVHEAGNVDAGAGQRPCDVRYRVRREGIIGTCVGTCSWASGKLSWLTVS